jgi:superkiller protein 3
LFINVGDAYRGLGLYDEAIQAYRQASIVSPDNELATDNLAEVRERVRMQNENIEDLEHGVDEDPRDLSRYADLVDAYLEAHREEDALRLIDQMIALESENPTTYETRAIVYESLDHPDEAADAWARVVELAPTDAEAWEHLGTWREEQGRLDEAITAYRKAVELSPDTPSLRFSLAELLREDEKYDESIATYRDLVQVYKGSSEEDEEELLADAYTGLAATLNVAGQYQAALDVVKEFLERFPEQPEAYYEQATAYSALGRQEEAIAAYESAVDGDPLDAGIYNDLAEAYLAVKRTDDAIEMAETAVSLDPEFATAYETLAQALLAAGRNSEAEEAMQRAAELHAEADENLEEDEEQDGPGQN